MVFAVLDDVLGRVADLDDGLDVDFLGDAGHQLEQDSIAFFLQFSRDVAAGTDLFKRVDFLIHIDDGQQCHLTAAFFGQVYGLF